MIRHRLLVSALAAGLLGSGAFVAGCGGTTTPSRRPVTWSTPASAGRRPARSAATSRSAAAVVRRRRPRPRFPRLLPAATATGDTPFVPVVRWGSRTVAWLARRGGLALLALDQRSVVLHLHSGTIDAGSAGWRWGPTIASSERRTVVAAFNGGFRFSTGAGGFASHGHVAVPLSAGLGSIVTYADGRTDIGAWKQGVPQAGRRVVSVRQNLRLLIDGGRPAPSIGCLECWGATLGGVAAPARSALGITASGRLIWVGGEGLTVGQLAGALTGAGVVRAVELDINPEWVAGYLYRHRAGHGVPAPVQVVPGQPGVPGQFLSPYQRDFFVAVVRGR